jgi:hypothetical protein
MGGGGGLEEWSPEDPEVVPVITESALKKLLLDVSGDTHTSHVLHITRVTHHTC